MVKRVATFKMLVDEKGAVTGLEKVSKSAGTTGAAFGKFGKMAKLAMGGVAAGSAIALGVEMAKRGAQIESIMGRTETVFGEGAAAAKAWADQNNEAFGTSEAGLLDMANGIQDLLVPLGFARSEAQGMTTDALDVANALSEWTGGQKTAAEATDAITKALLGEREMLKEYGVKLDEADIKQALMAKGQEKLTGNALAQAKAQVSLELIMAKSTDAIDAYNAGGNQALRDQKKLAAQVADLKDQAAVLATTLTSKLVPALSGVISELTESARAHQAFTTALEGGATAAEAMFAAARESSDLDYLTELLDRTGLTMQDLNVAMEGGTEGIAALTDGLLESGAAFDLSDVEARLLTKALEGQVAAIADLEYQQDLAAAAVRSAGEEQRRAGDATYYYRDAVRAGATAIRDHTAATMEAASPALAAISALRDLRDRQAEVNALRKEGKTNTEEFDAAVQKLVEAQLKMNAALEAAREAGGEETYMQAGLQAGLARDEVAGLNDELERYNNFTPSPKNFPISLNGRPLPQGVNIVDGITYYISQSGNIGT